MAEEQKDGSNEEDPKEARSAGWNHRVIRHKEKFSDYVAVHEVHYDESGRAVAWGQNPVPVLGDDVEELRWLLERLGEALEKPVIDAKSKQEM